MSSSEKSPKSGFELGLMIAKELFEAIRSEEGDYFVVPKKGPKIALRTNHPEFRRKLAKAFTEHSGNKRSLSPLVLDQIAMHLEEDAEGRLPERVHLRYAEVDGITYIDLGDPTGECVEISTDGWEVISYPPVNFRRSPLTLPMPRPKKHEGNVDSLFRFVNVSEEKKPLLLCWILSAFFPDIPHPIALFDGEKGTGKSRTLFYCGSIIDPNGAPLRKMPRDGERWVEAVLGGYFIPLDNLTHLTEEQSNQLCRASTGDSDVRRVKYTDDDLKVIKFKRLVGINGISVLGIRDDLADRLIHFETQAIHSRHRKTEAELDSLFRELTPEILSGLLDLVVQVKRLLPTIRTEGLPRMADFAKIVIAVDKLRGTDGYAEYLHDIDAHAQSVFVNEPFLILLRRAVKKPFHGDASTLHEMLLTELSLGGLSIPYDEVPRKALWVTTQLKRFADTLRRAGWTVKNLGNKNHAKLIIWKIEPPELTPAAPAAIDVFSKPKESPVKNVVHFGELLP